MMEYLGTGYGGWYVDLSLIPEGSYVISAGIGEDISFDEELIKRKSCRIIAIDPTSKAETLIKKRNTKLSIPIKLFKAALYDHDKGIMMYKNKNPDHVSDSVCPEHVAVSQYDVYETETVSANYLLRRYYPSVLKMDIEGAEFQVIKSLIIPGTANQICVEFHPYCSNKKADTDDCIDLLKLKGFYPAYKNGNDYLFIRTSVSSLI